MDPSSPAPVAPADRMLELDVLRGLALFGVMMVNLVTEFRVSIFEQFMPERGASPIDELVTRALVVAVEAKGFIVFSFLFGAGLAAQRGRGVRPIVRRLLALLAVGAAHLVLIWNGDILTEYALLGLIAVPVLGRSSRAILAAGVGCLILHAVPLPLPTPFPSLAAMEAHIRAAHRAYGDGGAAEVLAFRVRELEPIGALLVWAAPRTLGLMLVGAWSWRARLVERSRGRAAVLAILAALASALGLAAEWATKSPGGALALLPGPVRMIAEAWGPIALALGYAAAALACLTRPLGRAILARAAPLGQMALTNYLMQSLIFGFVFYGYGLAMFGRMGSARASLLGIAVYVAQLAASTAWLRRFRFGPIEWLWRSFTYGAWQPMRLDPDPTAR